MRTSVFDRPPRLGDNLRDNDSRADLPAEGEQITFERYDSADLTECVTLQVTTVKPSGWNMWAVSGVQLDGEHPGAHLTVHVTYAVIEARRVHRRK